MLTVTMINKENVVRKTKQIEFLKPEHIPTFVEEATKLSKSSGKPFYPLGFAYASMIYTGLRAGEMSALRWSDVDFENNVISITKNVQQVINRQYDPTKPELMEKKGIKKYIYVEGSTKTYTTRYVPMNDKARELLVNHYEFSKNTAPDDYVMPTREGNPNMAQNIGKTIGIIEDRAGIPVSSDGVHVLRHTCASMLFRNGATIQEIASMLGNSVEVCQETYVHFIEEQKRRIASKAMDDIMVD